jgi:peptidoglycan hydrolase-like protein with peptidoglycan-binding domain
MRRSLLIVALLSPALALASDGWNYAYDNPTAQIAGESSANLSPEQVRLVQRSLIERGYPVEPTGKFDEDTKKALKSFQNAEKLEASGTLDSGTARALGIDPAGVVPVRGETYQRSGSAPEDNAYPGPG